MDALTVQGHLAMLVLADGTVTLVRQLGGTASRPPAGRRERMIPFESITAVGLEPPTLLSRGALTLRLVGPPGDEAQPEVVRFSRSQSAAIREFVDALRESMATAGPPRQASVPEGSS
ncbi:hypothetical protein [Knoellia sp. LjRoot47]|uniref:hypothetical protein n=1 Tax=Knoellia sp. LjRoot47 TaxID=3342330 RepID=UPI003ECC37E3